MSPAKRQQGRISEGYFHNGLPPGWTTARIGEVLNLINGAAFKPSDWSENGLPIIRIQNLNNPEARYNRTVRQMPEKYASGQVICCLLGQEHQARHSEPTFGAGVKHG